MKLAAAYKPSACEGRTKRDSEIPAFPMAWTFLEQSSLSTNARDGTVRIDSHDVQRVALRDGGGINEGPIENPLKGLVLYR
ncbi:hypothetical protein CEE69_01165 [Rhodopirellula bahusiensis]|uniref:Uncharacterized protein n=1 Tax=Rhodopirellula bahusiensis TaxID=2014065 RepID=A0A2G1WD83_9BACT|nr:hypothetical protein CEE69_01165 [Rhodopirellula bahusiensis]